MRPITCITLMLILLVSAGSIESRSLPEKKAPAQLKAAAPAFCSADHRVGRLHFTVSNNGTLGAGYVEGDLQDCFTGEDLAYAEFPAGSDKNYLFGGALWIGGIVNGDTLVSVGADGWQFGREMPPGEPPAGLLEQRSTLDPETADIAVSEQDYIARFSDTIVPGYNDRNWDVIDGRPHIPLNVSITRKSYSWSLPGLRDLIFLDYEINNIGQQTINQMYLGLLVDGDVGHRGEPLYHRDDIGGYHQATDYTLPCGIPDTVGVAWIADNDGDPVGNSFVATSARDVLGMHLLNPGELQTTSFNWWTSNGNPALDYGPMRKANMRDFGTGGMGTPEGDRNKYWLLSNGDIDFDMVFTSTIGHDHPVWIGPVDTVPVIFPVEVDIKYALSSGPYNLEPGQSRHWSVAAVAGEHLHTDPTNFDDNISLNHNPDQFMASLGFSNFEDKLRLARRVYDTPGIDTDSDGYAGEYVLCDGDTVWVRGDGVPDWKPTVAPSPPVVWATDHAAEIRIRFNGLRPETELDPILAVNQFEGYATYLKEIGTSGPTVSLYRYDRENYIKFYYSPGGWRNSYELLTLEELRCAYGANCNDTDFYPLTYTPSRPYVVDGNKDSLLYFDRYGYNNSSLTDQSGIHKRFPDQPYPTTLDPSQAQPDELTDDGYLKYFEYEYNVTGLDPDKEYEVGVATLEYGSSGNIASTQLSEIAMVTPEPSTCCVGDRGDIDGDGAPAANAVDLSYAIDFLFTGGAAPPCPEEADLNAQGDGINIVDVSLLVDFLFNGGGAPQPCE